MQRVDYLASLSLDAVWFSPFYPSALKDGGYDVDDYRAVDPVIGTLDEFAEVVRQFSQRGIRVIIDVVPNHSSDRHKWFRDALRAESGSPERDRYIFRDGVGPGGVAPPTDWQSLFGGSAWTRVDDGQWYLHMFTQHQPDWNWRNKEVRADFLRTLRFWADLGVAGFRVDAATALSKDMSEPLPSWAEVQPGLPPAFGGGGESTFPVGLHPLWDRDDVQQIYVEWREVFDTYDPPLFGVAEAWLPPERSRRYANSASLGQTLDLDLAQKRWNPVSYRESISRSVDLAAESGSTPTWVFSNHDIIRHPTRFARELITKRMEMMGVPVRLNEQLARQGLSRALAATALVLALPGSAYIYQGEELGLPEVEDLTESELIDRLMVAGRVVTRDGCRVPLPWEQSASNFGFGSSSYLPQPDWFAGFSVEAQSSDPSSTLSFYRRALAIRRALRSEDGLEWIDQEEAVAFRRAGGWISVTNFGSSPIEMPPGRLVLTSGPLSGAIHPDTTVWLVDS
jgi:alpha-glucosidase